MPFGMAQIYLLFFSIESFHTAIGVFRTKERLFVSENKKDSVTLHRTIINKVMGSKVLIISNVNELVRVKPERVVYVKSDGNYSTMVLHDKTEHVFTMNLAHCQELIEKQLGKEAETFIRIGKQLIINRDYIFKINVNSQTLIMSDMALNQAFMLQASKEALKQLKVYMESKAGKEEKL